MPYLIRHRNDKEEKTKDVFIYENIFCKKYSRRQRWISIILIVIINVDFISIEIQSPRIICIMSGRRPVPKSLLICVFLILQMIQLLYWKFSSETLNFFTTLSYPVKYKTLSHFMILIFPKQAIVLKSIQVEFVSVQIFQEVSFLHLYKVECKVLLLQAILVILVSISFVFLVNYWLDR